MMRKILMLITIMIMSVMIHSSKSSATILTVEESKQEESKEIKPSNQGESQETKPIKKTENDAYLIQPKTVQREAKSKDGTVVLKCSFMYPQIKVEANSPNRKQIQVVNQLIETYAMQQFQQKCTEAVNFTNEFIGEIYQGNLPNSWLPFTVEITYDITLNRDGLLSFKYTDFEWLGGAHPNTNQTGFIYDTVQGKELKPEDLLQLDANGVKQFIADEVNQLYQKNPENYFKEEVENLQKLNFEYGYYLNDEGFVFFFNPYAVAPYVAGVVSVSLKYSEHPEKFRTPEIFQTFNSTK